MNDQVLVVIVTGVSGSGKSTALHALEDRGYFCIDNLPPVLIDKVVELSTEGRGIAKLAFVVDAREGPYLRELPRSVEMLRDRGHRVQVLFLDAADQALLRRFSETRRRHPLSPTGSVADGIRQERELLDPVRRIADRILETDGLSPHALKERVLAFALGQLSGQALAVSVVSFGFRNGLPPESDLVFDVRFLPNPHFIPELRALTGHDPRVSSYVLAFAETQQFLQRCVDLLGFLLPHYAREGKSYLTVAFGCTGGQHRSVAIANAVADVLARAGHPVHVRHRDTPPAVREAPCS